MSTSNNRIYLERLNNKKHFKCLHRQKFGIIEKIFEEPGKSDNCTTDPYGESSPENVLQWLEMGRNN